MTETRRARVRALAKINLDLRVLGKRADHYHELRTIFQTISLGDILEIAFTPSRRTRIEISGNVEIADNLVSRAAEAALAALRMTGDVSFRLQKVIPMGAGLGGGSTDAAAVLLALPVLAGRRIEPGTQMRVAAELGSDVPFFLSGGTMVGAGRGTELYPIPDAPAMAGLVVAPEVHVSTAAAYAALGPRLTTESQQNKIVNFQLQAWSVAERDAAGALGRTANDFEAVVFEQFPQLASVKRRLLRLGACPALMTGSGSAVFGLFRTRADAARAIKSIREERIFPIVLVSRSRYRALWRRWLRMHVNGTLWPPQSRYAQ